MPPSVSNPNEAYLQCPIVVDGERCGGELIVEWEEIHTPDYKTGKRFCMFCETIEGEQKNPSCEDFEGETVEHRWEDEWAEGAVTLDLISIKTYCWHTPSKHDVEEMMGDMGDHD